jgi:hypothetical protein
MTDIDKELNARINYNKGVALAAMACLQQLVRVIQERQVLTTAELRDAFSEAISMIKLSPPNDENEAASAAVALRAIEQFFAD